MNYFVKLATLKNIKVFYLYLSIAFIMTCCIGYFGWTETWKAVHVPTMTPVFADMRTVQGGLASVEKGLNPQVDNPHDPWGRVMNYPSIWLDIGRLAGIENETNYLVFCLAEIAIFLGVCGFLLYRTPSLLLLLSMVSTSSLLAIERGNNDMVLFALLFWFAMVSSRTISPVFLITSFALKLYPLFAAGVLIVKRKKGLLALTIIPIALIALWRREDYLLTLSGVHFGGFNWMYGLPKVKLLLARSWFSGGWSFPALVILIAVAVAILVPILGRYGRSEAGSRALDEDLFLVGACVYVGTYALALNFDYRLIFLIFCIPFLLDIRPLIGLPAVGLILVSMNFGWLYMGRFSVLGKLINEASKLAVFIILVSFLACGLIESWRRHRSIGGQDRGMDR